MTRIAGFPVQKIRELMAAILMCGMVDALVTSTTSVRDVSRLRFARSLTAQFTPLEDAAEARGVYTSTLGGVRCELNLKKRGSELTFRPETHPNRVIGIGCFKVDTT